MRSLRQWAGIVPKRVFGGCTTLLTMYKPGWPKRGLVRHTITCPLTRSATGEFDVDEPHKMVVVCADRLSSGFARVLALLND